MSSPATPKGSIKRQGANARSIREVKNRTRWTCRQRKYCTAKKDAIPENNPCLIQDERGGTTKVFVCATLDHVINRTFYTNIAGEFLVVSFEGMHKYFIAYDYGTPALIPGQVADFKDKNIVKIFGEVFNELKEKVQSNL